MKKKIAFAVVIVTLLITGGLGYSIYNKLCESEKIRIQIAQLPNLEIPSVYRFKDSLVSNKPTIINYFNTKCRFCQSEIGSIKGHEALLKEVNILFVSDEPYRVIEVFSRSFGLDTIGVDVVWDSSGAVKSLFGIEKVPATFIYGKDSILVEQFKGEISAEVIYNLIR